MSGSPFINRRSATKGCEHNYAATEQWVATCRITNNPRHLDVAHACYAIADGLYDQSIDLGFDRDGALMQRIFFESRKRVSDSFAALADASRGLDRCDQAAASMEGLRASNR